MWTAPMIVTAPPMQKPVSPTLAPRALRCFTAPRTASSVCFLKSSDPMAALAAAESW